MAKPSEDSPYQLLVEGSDDLNSILHLMMRHDFPWGDERFIRPYVSARGGAPQLLRDSAEFFKSAAYQRIGIVLDANTDLAARWAQIRDRARRSELELPEMPQRDGTIVPGRSSESRIGVWLMPDNSSAGTLEHFLNKLISAEDPIRAYADEAVTEARRRGARCLESDHIKSALHTWLAWQEVPALPFGTAIKAEYFEKDSDNAHLFVAWFRRLFLEP